MVMNMSKRFFLAMALSSTAAQPAIAAQTYADQVDRNVAPPPLAKEFGPQDEVSDGLDINQFLDNVGQHTDGDGAPDDVGAFRFICAPGHVNADDPVIYPGQKGASHPHQFYGNTGTNYQSTYENSRTTGLSTCMNIMNRSGYWQPAMINGDGKVVRPDYVVVYYKGWPKNSPQCTPGSWNYVGRCVPVPNAIRFIFGYDMVSGTLPTGGAEWKCLAYPPGNNAGIGGPSANNIVDAVAGCPDAQGGIQRLDLALKAPTCWDGKNLDSPNHRSHTADFIRANDPEGRFRVACPKTHPYAMPHFTLQIFWELDNTIDKSGTWEPGRKTWYLSSDLMPGMPPQKPGTTFHGDYWEGWNQAVKKMWQDNCIDRLLNCNSGDLGNGKALKLIYPQTWVANPRLVDRPAMRNEPFKVHIHPTQ